MPKHSVKPCLYEENRTLRNIFEKNISKKLVIVDFFFNFGKKIKRILTTTCFLQRSGKEKKCILVISNYS